MGTYIKYEKLLAKLIHVVHRMRRVSRQSNDSTSPLHIPMTHQTSYHYDEVEEEEEDNPMGRHQSIVSYYVDEVEESYYNAPAK